MFAVFHYRSVLNYTITSLKICAMKNLFALFALALLFIQTATAQSPQAIPFQAVMRDTNGVLIANQNISVRISIHSDSSAGTVSYKEHQSATTNKLGLVTLNIGSGTIDVGSFASIDWAGGTKYVQVEADPNGGTSYLDFGTTQLQSVPYALYSLNSGSGVAQPNGQVAYGNGSGTGLTSDATFTHFSDGTTKSQTSSVSKSSSFSLDSNRIQLMNNSNSTGTLVGFLSLGQTKHVFDVLDTFSVSAYMGAANKDSDIVYGFRGLKDSVEVLASDTNGNYGMLGTRRTNSFVSLRLSAC